MSFAAQLALREKQIQQSYRPIIGIHKWFARRPGTLFRSLLLSEYAGAGALRDQYWRGQRLAGRIADPFMGGGTPLCEANRLGFDVIGCDINPMAYWIVRQALTPLDRAAFAREAARASAEVEERIGPLYRTRCGSCGGAAPVKYFLWVRTARCPRCDWTTDLFPGHRLAEAVRHPAHVLVCASCGGLGEYATPPSRAHPGRCAHCAADVWREGDAARGRVRCRACALEFRAVEPGSPPRHRLWAIEYRCSACYGQRPGRQFKSPDAADRGCVARAAAELAKCQEDLPLPDAEIPPGDESARLHRWGYRRYREMFTDRQLLGLGLLLQRIRAVRDAPVRAALLTVFSDSLRYQNLLCRYDTYALKCQDIFSVHGFPVGAVRCENNLLGIPGVGSGSFRQFAEKYERALAYAAEPFETLPAALRSCAVPAARSGRVRTEGETITAELVSGPVSGERASGAKSAWLRCGPAQDAPLSPGSLDGVFTDPPYYDCVQYAELMDFCYVWLQPVLAAEHPEFRAPSTRSAAELTGNRTLARGLESFAQGLSEVFVRFGAALRPGAPFVFTYHHNDPEGYLPLVVALLDAGLTRVTVLPAVAEMSASLHIARTDSSTLDSVFVCRHPQVGEAVPRGRSKRRVRSECTERLEADAAQLSAAGVRLTPGDLRCLLAGHLARLALEARACAWDRGVSTAERLELARRALDRASRAVDGAALIARLAVSAGPPRRAPAAPPV